MGRQGFLIALCVQELELRRSTDRWKLKRLAINCASHPKQAFDFGQKLEESREVQEALPPNTMGERLSWFIHSASKKSGHLCPPSGSETTLHDNSGEHVGCQDFSPSETEMKPNLSSQDAVIGGSWRGRAFTILLPLFPSPTLVCEGYGWHCNVTYPARTASEEANVSPDPHYLSSEQGTYTYRCHRLWKEKLRATSMSSIKKTWLKLQF